MGAQDITEPFIGEIAVVVQYHCVFTFAAILALRIRACQCVILQTTRKTKTT